MRREESHLAEAVVRGDRSAVFHWWKEERSEAEQALWMARGDTQWHRVLEDGVPVLVRERTERKGGKSVYRGSLVGDDDEFTVITDSQFVLELKKGQEKRIYRHTLVNFDQVGLGQTKVHYTSNFVMTGRWRWWDFLPGAVAERRGLHQSGLRYVAEQCEKALGDEPPTQ